MAVVPPVFDNIMERILFVETNPVETNTSSVRETENVFSISLLFSGVRCILQYALLPFVLPLIGIAADAALPIMLVLNVVAMVSIVLSLRRFWRIRYTHRWVYLFVAVVALVLLTAFLVLDIQTLQS